MRFHMYPYAKIYKKSRTLYLLKKLNGSDWNKCKKLFIRKTKNRLYMNQEII